MRVDVPRIIFDLEREGLSDVEISWHCRVGSTAVYSWKMGYKRPGSKETERRLVDLHREVCIEKNSPQLLSAGIPSRASTTNISPEATMAGKSSKPTKRKARVPGGDAQAPAAVDESTTHVPGAVGLPTGDAAKADLAANPARASVLSRDGHVVRE